MMFSFPLPAQLKRHFGLVLMLPAVIVGSLAVSPQMEVAQAQVAQPAANGGAMTIQSDVQEANSQSGVVTARGNVQINYPARQIQATAAQAQYFSRERRIVLSGNVYVLQNGNSLRGETITYLIDEGRFVATPKPEQQVQSIYLVTDPDEATNPNQNSPQ